MRYVKSTQFSKEDMEKIQRIANENRWNISFTINLLARLGLEKREADEAERARILAGRSQIDMADKWEPNQVFYDQLSKATLLKLLAEGCGNDAAENCQTMKRSDLAVTVNERLAGRRILPPALRPSALPDAADSESQAA